MAIIKVRGRRVDVDIERELDRYTWRRPKWGHDRLIACSPFRLDSSPSFYCYIEDTTTADAGSWGDSGGAGDFLKGHFTTLLAFLRSETEYEIEEYLLAEYASDGYDEEDLQLDFGKLEFDTRTHALDPSILEPVHIGPTDYLRGRGIRDVVQTLMRVGYDPKSKAVAIPWYLPDGRLANIKYRKVDSKLFWYAKGGMPIRELLYGIDVVYAKQIEEAVIVEAEIDAMYCMSAAKFPAIAVGTSKLSDEKAEIIGRSSLRKLKIAADNDEAGEKMRKQIEEKCGKYVELEIVSFPKIYKDLNDIKKADELVSYIGGAAAVVPRFIA